MKHIRLWFFLLLLLALPARSYAAAPPEAGEDASAQAGDTGETAPTVITLVGRYDSADTAPVVRMNAEAQTITFRNHDTGRNYTLGYDNSSRFTDSYGREMSAEALSPGVLADVTFLKSTRHLNSLRMAEGEGVFVLQDVRDYRLPAQLSASGPSMDSMARIGAANYLMDVRTLILTEEGESSPAAVVEGDVISVCGVGHEIYAIRVTRGHGYLRLSSDMVGSTSLVGAWIELDNTVVRKISSRMLLTAPEGDYTLYILGNGANYSAPVSITRGRETVVDTAHIPITPPESGRVRFDVSPADAQIRVDGELLSGGADSVTLEYGFHTIELSAAGYDTMVRYLRVGSPSSVVRLQLAGSGAGASASASLSSGASDSGGTSGASASGLSHSGSASGASASASHGAGTSRSGGSGSGDASSGGTSAANPHDASNGAASSGTGRSEAPVSDSEGSVTVEGCRVYVDEPEGAMLFVNGNFIGFLPTSFQKVSGIHTVTLRMDGYDTVSYNIEVDESKTDKTYRFPELNPE